ncbi:MAG: lysostaphin resistance A-like protein [Nocardioides sp.]
MTTADSPTRASSSLAALPRTLSWLAGAAGAPGPTASQPSSTCPKWLSHWGTRLLVMLLLFVAVAAGAGVASAAVDGAVPGAGIASDLATQLSGVVAALLCYVLIVRFAERRRLVELSWGSALPGLVRGLLIGTMLFAATIGLIAVAGSYRVDGYAGLGGVPQLLGLAVGAGIVEEILLRGILLRILEETLGTTIALAISALFFGALHLLNPAATIWGAIAIALEAGVLLGVCYVATRRLWVPIGLHIGWNFIQGGVFGVTISGSGVGSDGMLRGRLSGPDWLSGGEFGAEASIVAVLVCLLVVPVFVRVAVATGQWRTPRWRSTPDHLSPV